MKGCEGGAEGRMLKKQGPGWKREEEGPLQAAPAARGSLTSIAAVCPWSGRRGFGATQAPPCLLGTEFNTLNSYISSINVNI